MTGVATICGTQQQTVRAWRVVSGSRRGGPVPWCLSDDEASADLGELRWPPETWLEALKTALREIAGSTWLGEPQGPHKYR